MAVGVNIPQRKSQGDGGLGSLLQLGGMVAGGLVAGPGGAAAGAATGGSLGGMAGGLLSEKDQSQGPQAVETGGSDALQRRMSKLQENPQMQIANSIDSLKYIQDPGQRAELAKPLLQADYMARNKQA